MNINNKINELIEKYVETIETPNDDNIKSILEIYKLMKETKVIDESDDELSNEDLMRILNELDSNQ